MSRDIDIDRDIDELMLRLRREEGELRCCLAEAEQEYDDRRKTQLVNRIVGLCQAIYIVKEWIREWID